MPTGYTATLHEGKPQTFAEFALRCARNFGALIMMRDDAPDAPISEFRPSPFYADLVSKTAAELKAVRAMRTDEAGDRARMERAVQLVQAQDYVETTTAIGKRYRAMLAEVEAWAPPTSDHVGLKDFMIQQLTDSLRYDGGDYAAGRLAELEGSKLLSGEEWKQARIDELTKDLERLTVSAREEVERTAARNLWVKQLRESLPASAPVGPQP